MKSFLHHISSDLLVRKHQRCDRRPVAVPSDPATGRGNPWEEGEVSVAGLDAGAGARVGVALLHVELT
jgi:hypothetical protein